MLAVHRSDGAGAFEGGLEECRVNLDVGSAGEKKWRVIGL
jgi:hypothetical protein